MFDLVAPDGHYVHVQGMADTGSNAAASVCANPRQGRTVVVTSGCSITSLSRCEFHSRGAASAVIIWTQL
jgi:hypothetical protein